MALVQTSAKFQSASVSGNQTYNMGSNFTAGNAAVVTFNHFNGGTPGNRISAVTLGGTSATLAVRVVDAANQNTWECWYVGKSGGGVTGGTTQIVLTLPAGTGQFITGSAEEWNDLDTIDVNGSNVTGTGSGSSTAPSATTSVSTSQTPVLLYGGFVDTVGTGWTSATPPTSWTETWEEPSGTTVEAGAGGYFNDSSATGTKTGTWTTGASMTWSAAIVAFRLTAGGPTINTQPTGQTCYEGQTATFTISATTSGGALSYQWKDDGVNVGTNSNSYTTGTATLSDNGAQITCAVTDSNGTTTSNAATWTVLPAARLSWIRA